MKRAFPNTMTDCIADSVCLAQESRGRNIEANRKRDQRRDRYDPAREICQPSGSSCLFHCIHYMGLYDDVQERFHVAAQVFYSSVSLQPGTNIESIGWDQRKFADSADVSAKHASSSMIVNRRYSMKRLGILTGGGDAPGLNAVIRAATKTAIYQYGCDVIGIRDGYDGFIDEQGVMPLKLQDV